MIPSMRKRKHNGNQQSILRLSNWVRKMTAATFLTLAMACGGNPETPATTNSVPEPQTTKTSQPGGTADIKDGGGRRAKLIVALQDLAAIFASRDAQRMAALFPFPVPDTVMQVYIDQPAFAQALEQSHGQLTHQIFLDFFPAISVSTMMPDMDSLFRHLPPADLATRDTLEQSFKRAKEPCAKYYRLAIEDETVVLVAGMEANDAYPGGDGGSEACETASVWVFYFDGQKLVLKQQAIAG